MFALRLNCELRDLQSYQNSCDKLSLMCICAHVRLCLFLRIRMKAFVFLYARVRMRVYLTKSLINGKRGEIEYLSAPGANRQTESMALITKTLNLPWLGGYPLFFSPSCILHSFTFPTYSFFSFILLSSYTFP